MGEKPSDQWTVPLCHDCHQNPKAGQHSMNEMEFWRRLSVNVFGLALTLWSLTGKHKAARRAVIDFRNWKRAS
ncbi:hypothetical protein CWO90_20250 [Bradyrhizobium sp. Leo121]|nr:hypothetical protein CWO90_20250 [Bradyrhizobium sp. Leo121]